MNGYNQYDNLFPMSNQQQQYFGQNGNYYGVQDQGFQYYDDQQDQQYGSFDQYDGQDQFGSQYVDQSQFNGGYFGNGLNNAYGGGDFSQNDQFQKSSRPTKTYYELDSNFQPTGMTYQKNGPIKAAQEAVDRGQTQVLLLDPTSNKGRGKVFMYRAEREMVEPGSVEARRGMTTRMVARPDGTMLMSQ